MKYVAIWNMPGCLPDCGPVVFDSYDDAKEFVCDLAEEYIDSLDLSDAKYDEEATYIAVARAYKHPFHLYIKDFVYSVEEVEDDEFDDTEA